MDHVTYMNTVPQIQNFGRPPDRPHTYTRYVCDTVAIYSQRDLLKETTKRYVRRYRQTYRCVCPKKGVVRYVGVV